MENVCSVTYDVSLLFVNRRNVTKFNNLKEKIGFWKIKNPWSIGILFLSCYYRVRTLLSYTYEHLSPTLSKLFPTIFILTMIVQPLRNPVIN